MMLLALVYLTTEGTFRVADISWWSAFALGIPLIWSIAHILLRQVLTTTTITPNQVTISRLVVSGAFLLLLASSSARPARSSTAFTAYDFQKAAIILGVAYYLELILWFYAMRHIDVSLASSVTVPAPAVTMLLSVVFSGRRCGDLSGRRHGRHRHRHVRLAVCRQTRPALRQSE